MDAVAAKVSQIGCVRNQLHGTLQITMSGATRGREMASATAHDVLFRAQYLHRCAWPGSRSRSYSSSCWSTEMDEKSRAERDCEVSPEIAARSVGLVYVNDAQPGISRERRGASVLYRDHTGQVVRDQKTLDRIAALVIPPAWKDVWI